MFAVSFKKRVAPLGGAEKLHFEAAWLVVEGEGWVVLQEDRRAHPRPILSSMLSVAMAAMERELTLLRRCCSRTRFFFRRYEMHQTGVVHWAHYDVHTEGVGRYSGTVVLTPTQSQILAVFNESLAPRAEPQKMRP